LVEFCRDCANFEDRRDIDGVALCRKSRGPYVCCEEFELRDNDVNENRLYHRFCLECANFENVNGTSVCAKNHNPGVACEEFTERLEKLNGIRQNNLVKTAVLAHTITSPSNTSRIQGHLIEVARKIQW